MLSGNQLHMASGLRSFAVAAPNQVAVSDGQRSLTFAALDDRSNRLATALLGRVGNGLRPGSRVLVLMHNCVEFFEVSSAVAKAGMVMVPLNPKSTPEENAYIAGHCEADAVVTDVALASQLGHVVDDVKVVIGVGTGAAGLLGIDEVIAGSEARDPMVAVDERDDFCIFYTSGTTGRPKGVRVSHRARVLAGFTSALEYGIGPGRRALAVAPLYHGAGFSFGYAGIQFGATTHVMRRWSPEALLHDLAESRAQSVFLVPTHAMQVRNLGPSRATLDRLDALETLYFNAAALPVSLKHWVHETFPGRRVHELYGSTECFVVTDLRPEDSLRKAGSVGHPWFLNEVELRGDDGRRVGPGEPGELFARSPMLMSGYLNDEAATEAATSSDGYITVGDVATYDDEGFISIVDRKKDMIISGGVNIYPREIEEVLASSPEVLEVSVVGVPDAVYGERVAAFVVPASGHEVDPAVLADRAAIRLAKHKVPRDWHIVGGLPRNASGKVLKRELKAGHASAACPHE